MPRCPSRPPCCGAWTPLATSRALPRAKRLATPLQRRIRGVSGGVVLVGRYVTLESFREAEADVVTPEIRNQVAAMGFLYSVHDSRVLPGPVLKAPVPGWAAEEQV
eukprot:scaffold1609_cov252-Pinguiococcus_pyrenoidosus.AAC.3